MKRKTLFLLIMLSVSIIKLEAQESTQKSLFLISPAYAIFNNGEAMGLSFSNEYVRNINKYFTYGARYMFAYGEGHVNELEYNGHRRRC